MKNNKYEPVSKEIKNQKVFAYSKPGVNLAFTLSTSDTSQLLPFKECLEAALADINEILKEYE
jgi:hypothetical protein